MSAKVLVTCRQMQNCIDVFRERLQEAGLELELPDVLQQPSEEELMEVIGDFDGMIAGDDPLTARVLEKATRMRVISKWGVGTDGIDFDAAAKHGIKVTNTPGVFGADVADVAAAYLVMVARQLHRIHESVAAGGWFKHEGRRLAGSTLGVAGFGSIGQAVAQRGIGLGMRVIAHDVAAALAPVASAMGVTFIEDQNALFAGSDFLVLCSPLTVESRHMLDAQALARMPSGHFIVNVARGSLVDEDALTASLSSGHTTAAALDVFEEEPLSAESPLRAFDQCVFGSHNGSNTREGVLEASALAVDNLLAGLGLTS